MKLIYKFLAFFLMATALLTAQNKEITLEDIYGGTFRQERLQSLQSLNNGAEYVVLNFDRDTRTSIIDVYSYKTGKKTRTLLTSDDLEGISYFRDFEFSDNEKKIILGTEMESIYRHSTRGIFYVYDLENGSLQKITDEKIQEPTLSPNGGKVAFVLDNNLFIKDLSSEETGQVTTDGEKNIIINGITDWVYEEEFAFVQAYQWNKSGEKIAFLRLDETEVPEFSMDLYGQELYPTQTIFKYHKAGS